MAQTAHRRNRKQYWAVTTLCLVGFAARAQRGDPTLSALVDQALEVRPELARARAEVQIARERVPQAESWADPMLQVGVQNDGFNAWQVGTMQTSWLLFMATQTVPLPGRLTLLGEVARGEVTARELALERTRLSTIADVRRAYVGFELARGRLELNAKLMALLRQAIDAANSRYEAGDGALSDVLRARLELARSEQQRIASEAEVAQQRQALNRLSGRPLSASVDARDFAQLAFPPPPDEADAVARMLDECPEYVAAQAAIRTTEHNKALNERAYVPDVVVGAGVMVRGRLDPMWTVTVGVPLPVFSATKQSRAVAEAAASVDAAKANAQSIEQLVRLRTQQRLSAWQALAELWRGYQEQLLAEAHAATAAALTQYRVGKVPFASVLEAATVTIGVSDAAYTALADAWRLAIAHDERSLGEPSRSNTATATTATANSGM